MSQSVSRLCSIFSDHIYQAHLKLNYYTLQKTIILSIKVVVLNLTKQSQLEGILFVCPVTFMPCCLHQKVEFPQLSWNYAQILNFSEH